MKLMYKMMISFMLIIILGGIVVAVTISLTTSRSFTAMVRESDIAYAEKLSVEFALFYEQKGSWEGVESLLRLSPQMGMQGESPMRGQKFSGLEFSPPAHMSARSQFRSLPVVLLDPSEKIIFSTIDVSELEFSKKTGIPVYNSEKKAIGSVFAGSMIGSELLPVQDAFLDSVKRAILFASIAVVLSTFIIGYFLVKQVTSPVSALQKASAQIAGGNLSAHVDITSNDELGELAAGFNSMAGALQSAEQWKKQIIADSAHELRTPVSLILGHLEMMLEGVYSIDRDGIQTIYDETLRLSTLISELQELSSAEAGHTSFEMKNISINDLIVLVVNTFKPKIKEGNMELNLELKEGLPSISVDRKKMHQVLMNIISNSLKFTPSNGSINISSWYDSSTGNVSTAIEDSGPGIPLAERTKIFDRFYRVDKHRNREVGGSGLGLAISSEIINQHGGTIKAVDPVIGNGARIIIALPV